MLKLLIWRMFLSIRRFHLIGTCASGGERAQSQKFLIHFCQALGLEEPMDGDYKVEFDVKGDRGRNFIDLYKRGASGVEMLRGLALAAAEQPDGVVIPAAGPAGAEGVLMPIGGYYYEPSRGAIPAYDNKWNNLSWESWLTYFPANHAPALDKPLAIVHSEAAAIPDGVRAFLMAYKGEAVMNWLNGIDQFSFYDREDAVDAVANAVATHFGS